MTDATARCARHPASVVTFTCPRCGTFGCVECERRPTLEAAPLCPACWALAAQTAAPPTGALQTAGLVVGVLSFIPCCPITIASLVVNVVALVKSPREHRWKPITGICISLVFGLLQVLFFAFTAIFSKR